MSLDRDAGVATLQAAIDTIDQKIKAAGGELTVKTPPRVVSERDERMLSSLMERLELANREVAGDDEDEDGEDDFGGMISHGIRNSSYPCYYYPLFIMLFCIFVRLLIVLSADEANTKDQA